MNPLIFAPLIRVSTEQQEQRGESLAVQRNQIIKNIELLHGKIPDHCWQYSGQEHATADFERKKFDQLCKDASKGFFNAVIVADISRWSRDNKKSKEGLEILKANGIRFFVGGTEYDLFNPEHSFILGMGAEVHELFARQQALKSIQSKIEKSKQNIPCVGLLPYGRTFNHDTKAWGIDQEKKKIIEKVAERYLNGESLIEIAHSYNLKYVHLHKILKKQCGEKWTVKLTSKKNNIDESIELTIPRLLSDETIERINEQAQANKTYRHGSNGERISKNRYLLGRTIFCTHCGQTLTGFANRHGKRYYIHYRQKAHSNKLVSCDHTKFVHADEIENSVLLHLVSVLGDPEKAKRALNDGAIDLQKAEELMKEKTDLHADLKNVEKQKERLIDNIADGVIDKPEAKQKMQNIRERHEAINGRIISITNQLETLPDPQRNDRLSKLASKVIMDATKNNPKIIFKRSWEWKRKLIENAFAGKDSQGNRLGIYLTYNSNTDNWDYEIRGNCMSIISSLPMSEEELVDLMKLNPDLPLSQQLRPEEHKTKYFLYLPFLLLH